MNPLIKNSLIIYIFYVIFIFIVSKKYTYLSIKEFSNLSKEIFYKYWLPVIMVKENKLNY